MNPTPANAAYWIHALGLEPHPEGGRFRESWRSPERLPGSSWPARFGGARSLGTSIYYLLCAGEHSRLHRLRADEVWHLYDGGPLLLHLLAPDGEYRRLALGRDPARGEQPQVVVPHGTWFGAELAQGVGHALAGCTVSPGFEYEDFELGDREALLRSHPAQREIIERLMAAGER
jgi:predicted cupin superfamily sugar epimerase